MVHVVCELWFLVFFSSLRKSFICPVQVGAMDIFGAEKSTSPSFKCKLLLKLEGYGKELVLV